MAHGQFEFDPEKSPTFSLDELQRMRQRALAEPGATAQFLEMAGTVQQFILGAKIDAVLLNRADAHRTRFTHHGGEGTFTPKLNA